MPDGTTNRGLSPRPPREARPALRRGTNVKARALTVH